MKKESWILLYKKFLNWEWYDHPPTKDVFLHCLLTANFVDENWKGQKIKRSQLPTSTEKLAITLGLTIQQTRTALKNLQTTNEINIQTTNRYSIITVKNYDLYQPNNIQKINSNNKQTGGGVNKQIGGSNNNTINNINKERDNKLSLSIEEREILKKYLLELNQKRKNKIEDIDAYIRKLVENGDCLTKLEKAKKKLARQKAKEVIPPPENFEPDAPEDIEKARAQARAKVTQIRKSANRKKGTQ